MSDEINNKYLLQLKAKELAKKQFKEISQLRKDSEYMQSLFWSVMEKYGDTHCICTNSVNMSNYAYVGFFKSITDDILSGKIKLPKIDKN